MWSKLWWMRTAERSLKTMAQVFVTLVGIDIMGPSVPYLAELPNVPTEMMLTSIISSGVLSLASSILTSKWTPDDSDPSAV